MEEKGGAIGPVASAAGSAVPKRQRLEFAYDGESRRVRKRVLEWSVEMNSWVLRRDVRFLYDGWSMIAEFEAKGGAGGPLALSATYAWGLDLSGTETGAGGVGGLLFVSLYSTTTTQTTVNNSQPPPTSVLAPCYDGNGNVLAYANTASGAVVARYEYDPFGQVMIREEAASVAGRLHHQFSTKYADAETGLVYYGFRYYSPELGRWVSRDPIEEDGGLNLYGMLANDPVNRSDYLGLIERPTCTFRQDDQARLINPCKLWGPWMIQPNGTRTRACLSLDCACHCKCIKDNCNCRDRRCLNHGTKFIVRANDTVAADCDDACNNRAKTLECPLGNP